MSKLEGDVEQSGVSIYNFRSKVGGTNLRLRGKTGVSKIGVVKCAMESQAGISDSAKSLFSLMLLMSKKWHTRW